MGPGLKLAFGVAWAAWAVGVWMVLVRRRVPTLAEQLEARERPASHQRDRAALSFPRRVLERAGGVTSALPQRALEALRLDAASLERDLIVLGSSDTVAYVRGSRLVAGLTWFLALPLARAMGAHVPVLLVTSLALGAAAFVLPHVAMRREVEARSAELGDGVAEVAVLLTLAVSAGIGVDEAFRRAITAARGAFAAELRKVAGQGRRAVDCVEDVAARLGVMEAAPLVSALRTAERAGSVSASLEELAWGLVEERRIGAIEAGQSGAMWMVTWTAALMVPGYLVLVAYPGLRQALEALTR